MLDEDLLRNGSNLSFKNNLIDTPLLYFDTINRRIGVNTSTPVSDLEVVGGLRFTDYTTNNAQSFGNLTIENGNISVVSGNLTIGTVSGQVVLPSLLTDDYLFNDNRITSLNSDSNVELIPNGTGEIDLLGSVTVHEHMHVTGSMHVSGNVDVSGDVLRLGDQATDTIDFNTEFDQNILVGKNDAYSLGSFSYTWKNLFSASYQTDDVLFNNNIIESTTVEDVIGEAVPGTSTVPSAPNFFSKPSHEFK